MVLKLRSFCYFYASIPRMKFLTSKYFWINAAGGLVAFFLVGFLIFKGFDVYTHRGQSIEVPDLTGMQLDEAKKLLRQKGFRVETVDSVYEVPPELKNADLGAVVDQNPKAGESVKKNRRFYLVIKSSVPPMVEMPDLVDLSLRQAIGMLEARGLKFGKAIPRPGLPPVMKQLYKGKSIKPGTKIAKGSVIDVWVGSGGSDVRIGVPNLVGMTRNEAIKVLSTSNLNVGAEIFTTAVKDSFNVKVIRQSPTATSEPSITEGADIDLWYGNN